MEKQVFASPDGAPAVGPYSPAVGCGELVFVSGHVPLDTAGSVVGSTPEEMASMPVSVNSPPMVSSASMTAVM